MFILAPLTCGACLSISWDTSKWMQIWGHVIFWGVSRTLIGLSQGSITHKRTHLNYVILTFPLVRKIGNPKIFSHYFLGTISSVCYCQPFLIVLQECKQWCVFSNEIHIQGKATKATSCHWLDFLSSLKLEKWTSSYPKSF